MKNHFDRSRVAVEQAARSTRSVIVVLILLVCAMLVLLAFLVQRESELHDAIREDAVWAVYQLDRETRALHELLREAAFLLRHEDLDAAETAVSPKRTVTHYDILYSRLSILANAKYNSYFEQSPRVKDRIADIRQSILSMEPAFDRISTRQSYEDVELGRLEETLDKLRHTTNTFLVRTNATISGARADARNDVFRAQMIALLFMVAIAGAAFILALNLLRQLRLVRRTREDLSKAAKEFEHAYEAAEAGNKAKSAFLATIGHEIRTPLNAIIGMSELLSLRRLSSEESSYVRTISSSGRALLEIINEILDFAKNEHGSAQVEEIDFRLDTLIREAVSVVSGQARAKNDTLTVHIEPSLRGASIKSDPTHLKRVLLNLLSNAVKFTENGQISVFANAETLTENRLVLRMEVADTGIGIPEEAHEGLFTAFHQVDSSIGRRFGGTGLGLAICKQLVEALGGTISVSSFPGRGTTFRLKIPVIYEAPPDILPDEEPAAQRLLPASLPKLQVLVVEDNAINQRVAAKFLEQLGQEVTIAADGQAAVELVSDRHFDLVLMDLQMPGMDGISATRAIRGKNAGLPVVAMTANASDGHRKECFEAGMNGFECKPITFQRLAALIREFSTSDARSSTPVLPHPASRTAVSAQSARPADTGEKRREELMEEFGADTYEELAAAFFENAEALLQTVEAASPTNDGQARDAALHTLMGAAENLGFCELARTARGLRGHNGTAGQHLRLRADLDRARSQFRRTAV